MIKRLVLSITVLWLVLAGCVRIPEHHGTVGKYIEISNANTECLSKDIVLPVTLETTKQVNELNSSGFTLLSWNTRRGANKGWREDFEKLSNTSDLVVLQEGYLTDSLRDWLNRKEYHWDIAKAFTYNDVHVGVMTASRIEPDFLCSFRAIEPLSKIPKTVLITRYNLSATDKALLLVNIHMINFSLDISVYRAQLEKVVQVVTQHRGPLIISGDFNSWNKDRMNVLEDTMQKLGAKPVTFETDHRALFFGQKVDHVFYRNLEMLESFTEKVETSDHNPMLVTFRLEKDE